jgi:N-acetylmuramoyl-L-alanine amidase
MPYYEVQQGECLVRIAAKFGFRDFKSIYNDPQNAGLRKERPNPNLIFPGDRIFIPDKRQRKEAAFTTQVHRFQVPRNRRMLRIALEDPDGTKLAGVAYELELDGAVLTGTTDGAGVLEHVIPTEVENGTLKTERYTWPLEIAHLNPIDDAPDQGISGIQARLRNLGYDPGPIDGISGPLTEAAIRAFQEDHPPLAVDGICGPMTQTQLITRYGC